jgi:alpha-glucosidase
MQLSAFFPFYRNHNVLSTISQEPYIWASVAEASRQAMAIRYSVLPYFYTLFWKAHTTGSTVMRALAWEFPDDPSLANADRQFLLGSSILVTPVLEQGATSVNGVFPGGSGQGAEVWYDWYSLSAVKASKGDNVTISAPLGHIPVFVRGGSVIPQQEPGYTTAECRKNPWGLIVALSTSGTASGDLYIDDGESLQPNATKEVEFVVANNALYASVRGTYVDSNPLANITILGVGSEPKNVTLNGQVVSKSASYNSSSRAVKITGLTDATKSGAWESDWVLQWE